VLRSGDPVEQEKRIKYRDLVANAVMLHNVADMTNVLYELRQQGEGVTPEVVRRLSPYLTEHIKRFGQYVLDMDTPRSHYSQNRCSPQCCHSAVTGFYTYPEHTPIRGSDDNAKHGEKVQRNTGKC
jgi:Tn3 transposase DDE domain